MTKSFTRKIHIAETVRKWPYSKCKPLHGKLSHKKNERQWSWYGKKIPCTSKNNQVPSEQKNSVKHPWRHRLDADLWKDPSTPEWGWGQEGRAEMLLLQVFYMGAWGRPQMELQCDILTLKEQNKGWWDGSAGKNACFTILGSCIQDPLMGGKNWHLKVDPPPTPPAPFPNPQSHTHREIDRQIFKPNM